MNHFVDRSRVETQWACPRKRFYNYHYNGKGIVPAGESTHLLFGKAIHYLVEHCDKDIAVNPDLDQLLLTTEITPDNHQVSDEWRSLYSGMQLVFNTYVLPKLLDEYDVVSSELETTMNLTSEIMWMCRWDKVIHRKSDGLWFILEIKTSSWLDKLMKQASTNFQLLMEIEAMHRHYQLSAEQLGGAILLVFDKGQSKRASTAERSRGFDGYRRLSPFTYWYKKDLANGTTNYSLGYAAGYQRTPVWTIPGWQEILLENFLEEAKAQVQLWPSVSFDSERTADVIEQVVENEQRLQHFELQRVQYPELEGKLMNQLFSQNFGNCNNDSGYGKPCSYQACCFSPNISRDPVASGEYEERTVNHEQEGDQER